MVFVNVKKTHPDAIIPAYATGGAACFDLHALYQGEAGAYSSSPAVRTGLAFDVPEGHVMLIYSRSGHGFKDGVRLSNCVGVIDADFRGEIHVKLKNDSPLRFDFKAGDRIAQAMILPIPVVSFIEVSELTITERGAGGFGSTGA